MAGDGYKLPGFHIFTGAPGKTVERRNLPELNRLDRNLANFAVQPKAWCDTEMMLKWIDVVWIPFVRTKTGTCMLLIDCCLSHLTPEVQKALGKANTLTIMLPNGETLAVQVLDVGINKPFKTMVTASIDEHLIRKGTSVGRPEMAAFVIDAWKQITSETIVRTFLKIGLIEDK